MYCQRAFFACLIFLKKEEKENSNCKLRGEHGLEKFKSNLKELRQAAGLTLDELADETGIGKRTIITIENEAGANPSVGTVKRLLKYFEITFEELYPYDNEG